MDTKKENPIAIFVTKLKKNQSRIICPYCNTFNCHTEHDQKTTNNILPSDELREKFKKLNTN